MRWMKPPQSLDAVPSVAPSGLAGRYLSDPDFAKKHYGHHWSDPDSIYSVMAELSQREYPRTELSDILHRQNTNWGMSPQTHTAIDALADGALCVITGQQAGLFGGPLYTVFKALSAAAWATKLSTDLNRPVVPIFWIAGDDHDLDEIDHTVFYDTNGSPKTLRYGTAENRNLRVSRQIFEADITEWLDTTLAGLPTGIGTSDVVAALRDAYQPGVSWVDAFGSLMTKWLGRFGLIFVNPDDADLKRLMAPVFRREIGSADESHRAVLQANDTIIRAGYAPQVTPLERSTPIFIDCEDGSRCRVDIAAPADEHGSSPRYTWHGQSSPVGVDEMLSQIDTAPGSFSANALLRPVTGDAVFPTVLHVMGPGEIAYMAQSRALYEQHGIPMPVVAPRAGFTIVDTEVETLLTQEGMTLSEAFTDPDRLVGIRAEEAFTSQYAEILDDLRTKIDAAFEDTENAIAVDLPGIRTAATSNRMKAHGLVNRLERKVTQELRRNQTATRSILHTITDSLFPSSRPQERVYSFVPWLVRYDESLIDEFATLIAQDLTSHRAVFPSDMA
jgi:bacillithiol synthase